MFNTETYEKMKMETLASILVARTGDIFTRWWNSYMVLEVNEGVNISPKGIHSRF